MDENDVWSAGVFLDGVWSGTEGSDVWEPSVPADPAPEGVEINQGLRCRLGLKL